ncbi:hypothetical protein [Streptomyces sp. NPDC005828]|uniref:hypothetical protein n=1 Tax=Streptomyces sp. NPDC005828 TaxID=3157071 RepID=UPI0033E74611
MRDVERGERPVTVDNGAGVVVIGDGNHVVSSVPPVRSAYREQVGRIAPAELDGREHELAELAAFCRSERGYLWWRADAWAGKTALLSWFALDPPPGVRIVPFFVTARWAAQNDATAYVDVVLEQLAELAAEPVPALLTAATRQAHLLRLYGMAARACAERGERLVLLVDGLDEDRGVTTGPDAHSIAALLPYDLPVIVSGRPNPPLPADVPEDHPLRDPAIVRILSPSLSARAIRVEAERELKHLLEAGGLPYALLGLLTAAGGGLTADDLAELTGEVPYRVRDVLRTGRGRTFAVRGDAYLLGHEELDAGAREMLGERDLGGCRERLHAWAEEWRDRGWPEGTPEYLLRGYVAMLRGVGDVDRLVGCALDAVRHERLLAVTGGDGAALTEVRTAEVAVLAGSDRPELVAVMLRIALRRDALEQRGGLVPPGLMAGWAAVGEADRALAMARGTGDAEAVEALCGVARTLWERGERESAEVAAAHAEALAQRGRGGTIRDDRCDRVASVLILLGAHDRAERLVRRIRGQVSSSLPALVNAFCRAGEYGRALGLARDTPHPVSRARARVETVLELVRAGCVEEAVRAAGDPEPNRAVRGIVLIRTAAALRGAGDTGRASVPLAHGLRSLDAATEEEMYGLRQEVLRALLETQEFQRVRGLGFGPNEEWTLVTELARIGSWEWARSEAERRDSPWRENALSALAWALAGAGRPLEAQELVPRLRPVDAAQLEPKLAAAWLEYGELDLVEARVDTLIGATGGGKVIGGLVRCLLARGEADRAHAVVARLRRPGRSAGTVASAAAAVAEALHDSGHTSAARDLLLSVEERCRVLPRHGTVRRLAATVRALAEAGRSDEAAALLGAGGMDWAWSTSDIVLALLAIGRTERAEGYARAADPGGARDSAEHVVAALIMEGAFDRAEVLAQRWADSWQVARAAATAYADAGEPDRAAAWIARHDWDVDLDLSLDENEAEARLVRALDRQGRFAEAGRRLDEAMNRIRTRRGESASMLPSVVRALIALGRREKAYDLVREAVEAWPRRHQRYTVYLFRSLLALDEDEQVFTLAETLDPDDADFVLPALAVDLARGGRHERAAAVLAGLHELGPQCGESYTVLASEHPDPVRARRFAALGLSLGPWYYLLPGVLSCAPETVPLVLEEAERLRRALEV